MSDGYPQNFNLRTIRPGDLAAVQRAPYAPSFELSEKPALVAPERRLLFQVNEVAAKFETGARTDPRAAALNGPPMPPMTAAFAGLHGARVNVVVGLEEHGQAIRLSLGTWGKSVPTANPGAVLLRALRGRLAPIRALRLDNNLRAERLPKSGLVLGIPTFHEPTDDGTGNSVDKLIRAMAGQPWRYRIFASPLTSEDAQALRLKLLEDMRQAESAVSSSGAISRLANLYFELLDCHLKDLGLGLSMGLWRVAVYLEGTESSYAELAAIWTGLFTGTESAHAPLSTYENTQIGDWNRDWVLPDEPGPFFLHPFAYQSVLNSAQLATIADFPSLEVNGFSIRRAARFDVAQSRRTSASEDSLTIGMIEDTGVQRAAYEVPIDGLKRHAFITGVTGAGKTNTMFQLLRQIDSRKVPFLVLEPAKNEYRALVNDAQLRGRMRVYTIGDERTTPLRMNPFEVIGWPIVPIGVHIDLLRSSFAASFGMWTPLPQILEQCLHEIYEDRGWDTVTNTNARLPADADPTPAFPTMSDLARKVDIYTSTLGYDDRVRADLRAALLTRINGMRVGGKGAMLDCKRSTPMEELLDHPVVLELQNLGDDDDKAFFMALLFMRLVEYRRAAGGTSGGLRHLLVIEEAHRLLTNVSAQSGGQQEYQADPRGKAVETFANLISEVRAYGQGIAILDQVPTKLSPDVIKNSNLKVVHRIVAEDDRTVLAGAMAMNEEQRAALAILGVGKAVLFEEGEDAPLLVTVPKVKDGPEDRIPKDAELRTLLESLGGRAFDKSAMQFYPTCKTLCTSSDSDCRLASDAADEPLIQRTFAKLTVSLLYDANARERLWGDFEEAIRMKRPALYSKREQWSCLLTHLSCRLAERWGSRQGWSFPPTASFGEMLLRAVSDRTPNGDPDACDGFRAEATRVIASSVVPCAVCDVSAGTFGDRSPCMARLAVEDLIDEELFNASFAAADQQDTVENSANSSRTWTVCNSAAFELVEFPSSGLSASDQQKIGANARRCLLCFGHHLLVRQYSRSPWVIEERLNRLVSNHTSPENPNEDGGDHDKSTE